MHLDAGAVRCLGCPEVQVFMSPRLEVKGIVAVVEVGKFGEKVEVVFRVQFGI
jgi:hypothetical protein